MCIQVCEKYQAGNPLHCEWRTFSLAPGQQKRSMNSTLPCTCTHVKHKAIVYWFSIHVHVRVCIQYMYVQFVAYKFGSDGLQCVCTSSLLYDFVSLLTLFLLCQMLSLFLFYYNIV